MPDLMTTQTFTLEVGGVEMGNFRKASGLKYTTEVVESREVNKDGRAIIRKVPGAVKWDPITLERRMDDAKALWEWRQMVVDGDIDGARRDGSIVVKDSTLKEVARWNFTAGWCSEWSGSDLDASANAIAIEKVSVTHEGLFRA